MDARTSRLDEEVFASESAPPKQERLLQWNVALPIIVLAAYFAALMVHFAYKGDLYLSFFVDDFFYYLVVAKNLVLHGASTFNGLQATNGYHPLWLLTIALLYKIFHTQLSFFVALSVLIWLLVCGSYRALRRTQLSLGIGGDAGLAWALLSITCMAVLSRTGMEIGLALFCLSLFWERMATRPLESQTPAAAFVSGLLASALVLSRLDACLVVAAYGGLTLIAPSGARRTAVKQVFYFGCGALTLWRSTSLSIESNSGPCCPSRALPKISRAHGSLRPAQSQCLAFLGFSIYFLRGLLSRSALFSCCMCFVERSMQRMWFQQTGAGYSFASHFTQSFSIVSSLSQPIGRCGGSGISIPWFPSSRC